MKRHALVESRRAIRVTRLSAEDVSGGDEMRFGIVMRERRLPYPHDSRIRAGE